MDPRARGLAYTTGAAVLWGTSFPANDLGLDVLDPSTFAFLRFAVAALVVGAYAAARGDLDPRMAVDTAVWGLAAFHAAAFWLQYQAQVTTTPGRAALWINLDVLWVGLGSWLLLGRRLGRPRAAAVVLAVLGGVLLEAGAVGGSPTSLSASLEGGLLRGDLLALAGGAAWAGYFLWNDRAVQEGRGPAGLLAATFAATAVLLLPPALLLGSPPPASAHAWGAVLYTSLLCSALAYGLWIRGLRTVSATASAVVLVLEVGVAAGIAAALGREVVTAAAVAGGLLLLAAMVLAAVGEAREPDASTGQSR